MNHTSEVGKTNPGLRELKNEVGRETEEHERNSVMGAYYAAITLMTPVRPSMYPHEPSV